MIDVSLLDMLYSQYGGGDNQQETMQKLNALQQQWQQPPQQQQQQQNRRYGPWEAIAQIANTYARSQQQAPQQAPVAPAPNGMQVGAGIPSILDALTQNRGGI